MKKSLYLLLAFCVLMFSCEKNGTDTPSGQMSTPAVKFSYLQNDVIKAGMTMVLTVDGKDYTFNKDSDEQTIKLSSSTGTISFDCKADASKTYTEKQDLTLSLDISAISIAADGKSCSAVNTLLTQIIASKGTKADKVTESLQKFAMVMSFTKTYEVDSKGIITVR